MTGLLLLPSICRGTFPELFILFILGYLGMPRRYQASTVADPAVSQHFNAVATLAGLLVVTFLFLNGLLWFKDVFDIIRKLRTSRLKF